MRALLPFWAPKKLSHKPFFVHIPKKKKEKPKNGKIMACILKKIARFPFS